MGVIVAVDGGGSKTDAVVLSHTGEVLARARSGGSSPQIIGLDDAVAVIGNLVRGVLTEVRADRPARLHAYLSGLDLPEETAAFRDAVGEASWVPVDDRALVVDNDMFALLRAGTDEPDAVAVVCGTGINAIGVRADGRQVRYPALGAITGDWGGGWQLGEQALWHAVRAEDGRGTATRLVSLVPAVFGLASVQELVMALHHGDIPMPALRRLCPTVLQASADGDAAARSLVDRQATEIVTLAVTTLRRLDLLDVSVPVVLGGGVIASGDVRLMSGVLAGLAERAPLARVEHVRQPPVVGAAMLALGGAGADAAASARVRGALAPALASA